MASTKEAAGTVEDIHRDVQALRDDLAKLAGQVSALLSAGGGEAMAGLKDRVHRMQDTVSSTRPCPEQRAQARPRGAGRGDRVTLQPSVAGID